jgi:hypothetical protein
VSSGSGDIGIIRLFFQRVFDALVNKRGDKHRSYHADKVQGERSYAAISKKMF